MLVGCLSIETFKNPTQIAQEKKAGDTEGRDWYDRSHNCKVPGIDLFLSEGEVQKLCWHSVLDWAPSEFSAFTSLSNQHPCQRKGGSRKNLRTKSSGPWLGLHRTHGQQRTSQWPWCRPCTCPHLESLGLHVCVGGVWRSFLKAKAECGCQQEEGVDVGWLNIRTCLKEVHCLKS